MRKIDITELMDNYTDNEFNIGGEAGVEADKVVSAVLPQVEQRKKVKPLFKVIAAVAAAVVLAGAATAAALIISSGTFTMANGGESSYELYSDGTGVVTIVIGMDDFLMKEDDRLYFSIDGRRADITDIIDPHTPYIYTYETEGNSEPVHIIIGGTPEHYAYVQMAYYEGLGWSGTGLFDNTIRERLLVSTQEKPVYDDNGNILHEYMWSLHRFRSEDRNKNDYFDSDETTSLYDYSNNREFGDELPENWREESEAAWLIDALAQLGIIELPDYGASEVTSAETEETAEETAETTYAEEYSETEPELSEQTEETEQ